MPRQIPSVGEQPYVCCSTGAAQGPRLCHLLEVVAARELPASAQLTDDAIKEKANGPSIALCLVSGVAFRSPLLLQTLYLRDYRSPAAVGQEPWKMCGSQRSCCSKSALLKRVEGHVCISSLSRSECHLD